MFKNKEENPQKTFESCVIKKSESFQQPKSDTVLITNSEIQKDLSLQCRI